MGMLRTFPFSKASKGLFLGLLHISVNDTRGAGWKGEIGGANKSILLTRIQV